MSNIKFLNPFKIGDLLSLLPGIKHLYEETGNRAIVYQRIGMAAYHDNSEEITMSIRAFKNLKPLIEAQGYIESYIPWNGEKVDIDFTNSRDSSIINIPYGSIHFWQWFLSPEMQCDLYIPWIEADEHPGSGYRDKIIISRTARYTNPYISYFFLKEYQDKILFSGTEDEHEEFNKKFNLDLTLLKAQNFLELAQIIKAAKFTLANQNPVWHLADAQKTLRLLECSTTYPNTFPTGRNGYVFMHQESLEFQFKKMAQ